MDSGRVRRVGIVLVFTAIGCVDAKPENPLLRNVQQVGDVRETLERKFSSSGPILFRSWNGVWVGADDDAHIELRPDGTAVLTEFGHTVREYMGTYGIDDESQLSLKLNGYQSTWPKMFLYTDASVLLLAPSDGSTGRVTQTSEGQPAPEEYPARSYWPFRQIAIEHRWAHTEFP